MIIGLRLCSFERENVFNGSPAMLWQFGIGVLLSFGVGYLFWKFVSDRTSYDIALDNQNDYWQNEVSRWRNLYNEVNESESKQGYELSHLKIIVKNLRETSERTPNNYQVDCSRTEALPDSIMKMRISDDQNVRLLHAGIGLATEAGEFLDQMKRHVYYGKHRDDVNLKEEISDVLWYCSLACNALNISMAEVMDANIRKLKARYPEKFSEEKANTRDLDVERAVLEDPNNDLNEEFLNNLKI